ncbi:MAG TPA: nucleoside hydrolase [Chitinophagaceae bacterium]|nr:nucleoside hydrolase [Chitinophagaceae bacterium]
MNILKRFSFIFLLCFIMINSSAQKKSNPVAVIFDSDIGPDYDDVGAITLLHAFAYKGEAKILTTVASNKYPHIAAVLSVFNTYFKRPDLLIGVPKGNAVNMSDEQHWSDSLLAKYPHNIHSNDEADDAVKVYRKTLSQQPDNSVTIVTVGFLTNLANLLNSQADEYSKLDGAGLVKQKVKRLVSMAGKFPEGKEFNVEKDSLASQIVFSKWPTEVIFSGFEIGEKIKTGLPLVQNNAIQNSPVKDVFSICLPMAQEDNYGRSSWDETAVLVAIKGTEPYYSLQHGHIIVNDDGSNSWDNNGANQYYLVEKLPHEQVQNLINELMQHLPAH